MKTIVDSPFDLNNTEAYLRWRDVKLSNAKTHQDKRIISLEKTVLLSLSNTPPHFLPIFSKAVKEECEIDNFCLYRLEDQISFNIDETRQLIHSFAKSLGLNRLDGNICADADKLTSICRKEHRGQHEYIPYTDKKLSWHTDGYYNQADNTIYSMLLHCYQKAQQGGESAFMDHEIAYILLRDENPDWIAALSRDKVMTIPANILNGKMIREEQTGPVFTVSPQGHLHMRYSARLRNIIWRQEKDVLDAVNFLQQLLDITQTSLISDYIVRHRFQAGEGIICRNILHCRSAFDDNESSSKQRLLFRGRFYDELP